MSRLGAYRDDGRLAVPPADDPQAGLEALTGIRSGKRSFYPAYVRSAERLEHAVRALDGISRALVRTVEGPRPLVEAIVRTAGDHLQADWVLFAVADGVLRAVRPRFLVLADGVLLDEEDALTDDVRAHLDAVRGHPWEVAAAFGGAGWVRAPMTLDGEPVGGIVGRAGADVDLADTDLAVLRVLANQAAVALHNSSLLHSASRLRGRTERLSETAARHARDLATRNAELERAQRRLGEAMQWQTLDHERHRIARELHDSVAQDVLSAGMTIELCRAELAGGERPDVVAQLVAAKELTRRAVERLRGAIYALHNGAGEPPGSLPVLLERLSTVHLPSGLTVGVVVAGVPVPLPAETESSLLRLAGEALFNTASHAAATRARIRLAYETRTLVLTVADDGDGDPAQLRRALRVGRSADLAGSHRGLTNMLARAEELGGTLSFRRARLGGVEVRLEMPMPSPAAPPADEIAPVAPAGREAGT